MASWFAGLRPLAGARAACELPADAVVSLRMADAGARSLARSPGAMLVLPTTGLLLALEDPQPGEHQQID